MLGLVLYNVLKFFIYQIPMMALNHVKLWVSSLINIGHWYYLVGFHIQYSNVLIILSNWAASIEDRLLDSDEQVRKQAVFVACDIFSSNLKLVSSKLLSQVSERLRDIKACAVEFCLLAEGKNSDNAEFLTFYNSFTDIC